VPGGHLSPYPAKVRERAVRSLISAGGVVLICPVGARTAAGRGWRLGSRAEGVRRALQKRVQTRAAGRMPRLKVLLHDPRPSLHPGLYHPTSGSPHPDTRGWAKPRHASHGPTAPSLHTAQRRWATKPTTLCPLSSSEHTLPAALLHAPLAVRERQQHDTRQHARTSSY